MTRRTRIRSRRSLGGQPDEKHQGPACSYCARPLDTRNAPVHFKCQEPECRDINYVLCPDCYSVGAALPPHRHDHPYTIVEPLDVAVFDPEWTAKDECKLLDALSNHGLHKWDLIAAEVGKSAQKCEAHYFTIYLGENAPLPTSCLVVNGDSSTDTNEADELRANITQTPKSNSAPAPTSPPTLAPPRRARCAKRPILGATGEMSGYQPKRGEYEVEFDDTAEEMVAELEMNENDSEEQQRTKEKILMLFNRRLELRENAKRLALGEEPITPSLPPADDKPPDHAEAELARKLADELDSAQRCSSSDEVDELELERPRPRKRKHESSSDLDISQRRKRKLPKVLIDPIPHPKPHPFSHRQLRHRTPPSPNLSADAPTPDGLDFH